MVVENYFFSSTAETLLFSFGGGGICGYLADKALRLVVKTAAVVIGAFILVLAFLSYRGWIAVQWEIVEDQTKNMAYNASQQILQMVHETATKFQHPGLVSAEGTPMAMGVGFIGGLYLGLRR